MAVVCFNRLLLPHGALQGGFMRSATTGSIRLESAISEIRGAQSSAAPGSSMRDRAIVTRSRFLHISGPVQNQGGVIHVKPMQIKPFACANLETRISVYPSNAFHFWSFQITPKVFSVH
jgi:hypothetical protein